MHLTRHVTIYDAYVVPHCDSPAQIKYLRNYTHVYFHHVFVKSPTAMCTPHCRQPRRHICHRKMKFYGGRVENCYAWIITGTNGGHKLFIDKHIGARPPWIYKFSSSVLRPRLLSLNVTAVESKRRQKFWRLYWFIMFTVPYVFLLRICFSLQHSWLYTCNFGNCITCILLHLSLFSFHFPKSPVSLPYFLSFLFFIPSSCIHHLQLGCFIFSNCFLSSCYFFTFFFSHVHLGVFLHSHDNAKIFSSIFCCVPSLLPF